MDNAILQYFQDKRRKEERERAEKARERTQRSEKVKGLKEETERKPLKSVIVPTTSNLN